MRYEVMSEEERDSVSETPVTRKSVRPVLIVSEDMFCEYSMFMEHLLVGLADESVAAALVCAPQCDVGSIVCPGAEVMRYPVFDLPFMTGLNNKLLVGELEKFKPTVLHCLCSSRAGLTRQLAKKLNLPYVLSVNSFQKRVGWFSISLDNLAKIIVPCKSIAANVAEVYPGATNRIEQINIGTFVDEESGCFRGNSELVSMVVAHQLNDVDDFENLFGALRHLGIDGHEFMVVLIGDGKAERAVRKLLAVLGLSQMVTIVPRVQPWRSVLSAGDIFIQPVPSTTFDPLLLEAMGVGTAVAGCKGGADDLIMENETAVVFDPDDELSIYSSLQRLLDAPEFARKLAGRAQEYLRENHSVSKMVDAVLDIYRLV